MAEGTAKGRIPKSHFTQASKNDKDRRIAVLKLLIAVSGVKKHDVSITYPENKEDDLVVKVKDEVFYSERLPDAVIRDECWIRKVNQKNDKSEIEIVLRKETDGMWLSRWCMER